MGKSETVHSGIGVATTIKDIYDILTPENCNEIHSLLCSWGDSFILDDNEEMNGIWSELRDGYLDRSDNMKDLLTLKELLKTRGSDIFRKYKPEDEDNLLHARILLYPISLVKSSRYGYDRYGINGEAEAVNLDLLGTQVKDLEAEAKKLGLENFTISFYVRIYSG